MRSKTTRTRTRYYVYTWDTFRQSWTPQSGVRCGPYSKWGLRGAYRKLRAMGYPCNRVAHSEGDPSVCVVREQTGRREGR